MTNKKIDIWLRFVLYFLPILYSIVAVWLSTRQTGEVTRPPYFYTQLNTCLEWTNTAVFQPFTNWVHSNIANILYIDFLLFTCYYIIYVELVLLFKNVMIFIIRTANEMIERGYKLGDK